MSAEPKHLCSRLRNQFYRIPKSEAHRQPTEIKADYIAKISDCCETLIVMVYYAHLNLGIGLTQTETIRSDSPPWQARD
eukprot:scaffold157828_cov41-Prasinocladus_malaysianus.AAC.1